MFNQNIWLMKVERGHRNIYRLTMSSYELSALISATRWVTEGTKGELTPDAINYLKEVLKNYDDSLSKLNETSAKSKITKQE